MSDEVEEVKADACDILLKNVPGDIVRELGRRAEEHFRSRSGEILAILAAACREVYRTPQAALDVVVGAPQIKDIEIPPPARLNGGEA